MLDWYQHLPLTLSPIAFSIGPFSVRWYSLSYLVGFLVVYILLAWRIRRGESRGLISNLVQDYIIFIAFVAIIFGRLGYVVFYNPSYFLAHPWQIILPYDGNGFFVGIFGMSYYGALIGILGASWVFCRKNKLNFLSWADFIVPAVPLGYFFGRVGNFLNGELFGRVTSSKLGMYFSTDPGELRYPSQLLEASLEGIVLFIFLWSLRNKKMFKNRLLFVYIIGYSFFRFWGEFFRNPDPQIGLMWGIFSMGQALSFLTILIASIWLFQKSKKGGILSKY
jgi:phosphatidylglycerol:prolipoprotein diacylglycerol transferase